MQKNVIRCLATGALISFWGCTGDLDDRVTTVEGRVEKHHETLQLHGAKLLDLDEQNEAIKSSLRSNGTLAGLPPAPPNYGGNLRVVETTPEVMNVDGQRTWSGRWISQYGTVPAGGVNIGAAPNWQTPQNVPAPQPQPSSPSSPSLESIGDEVERRFLELREKEIDGELWREKAERHLRRGIKEGIETNQFHSTSYEAPSPPPQRPSLHDLILARLQQKHPAENYVVRAVSQLPAEIVYGATRGPYSFPGHDHFVVRDVKVYGRWHGGVWNYYYRNPT